MKTVLVVSALLGLVWLSTPSAGQSHQICEYTMCVQYIMNWLCQVVHIYSLFRKVRQHCVLLVLHDH